MVKQEYTPNGYVDPNKWEINWQMTSMESVLLSLLSNSTRGGGNEKIIKELTSLNSFESLKNLAEIFLDKNGAFNYYFRDQNPNEPMSKKKLFFVNNQSLYNSNLCINLTFTEEQLEKIKGFKLIKK